ncbi:hypothetical protein Q9S36_30240 [Microbacterium sp. ARD31]|uniref:hypothetical protein n=1 Tax=Microbacterium sp. ARD31 TaxID=2962576 RepID=UPI002880E0EA|nr:hypothetical protein [Microbacterium sp. ARD31]MDT0184477.1 hypothetical protein [Microbacterium sp. ARD31]
MVHVSLSARLTVADGPVLPLGMDLTPDTYAVSEAVLAAQGDTDDSAEIALVPDDVSLALLAISAKDVATGAPAPITVVPSRGTTAGDAVAVKGSFLLANADVLGRLVTDGPQLFTVTNEGTTPTRVRLLAAFQD